MVIGIKNYMCREKFFLLDRGNIINVVVKLLIEKGVSILIVYSL